MANYQSAPWGNPVYGAQNQPITSVPGRLPNPIGEEGIKLLKSKGGSQLNFYVKQEDLVAAMCNHRHNGDFDVTPDPELPQLYRCNICGELVDLCTKYDPALVKKVVDYLWAIFNSIKSNNNGIISNAIMNDLATGMLMVKHMPKMLNVVNTNLERNILQRRQSPQPQYRRNGINNAINMIMAGGAAYSPHYQENVNPNGGGQYWEPQDIVQAQQQYYQEQAQQQPQYQPQVYYQTIPFAAGSGQPVQPQPQVIYQPQVIQVPYDGQYSQATPPPQAVTYPPQGPAPQQQPQYQPQQYQTVPQVPPQAAASVVPEVAPPQPAPAQPQAPTMSKVFKK